jgi:hypothetical protein
LIATLIAALACSMIAAGVRRRHHASPFFHRQLRKTLFGKGSDFRHLATVGDMAKLNALIHAQQCAYKVGVDLAPF